MSRSTALEILVYQTERSRKYIGYDPLHQECADEIIRLDAEVARLNAEVVELNRKLVSVAALKLKSVLAPSRGR